MQGQPFLENLAVAPRGLAEFQRRGAGGAAKRAHEIGQVGEADIIGDIGDRAVVVGQPPRRMAQPRADQILVRGDAERLREQPQEVEGADPGLGAASSRLIWWCDSSIDSSVSTARRRSRAASGPDLRCLPETTSTKRLASTWPISSRPMSLLPSAAACASSPSTTSPAMAARSRSARGLAVADRFHQFGRKKNDRHSSPQTCRGCRYIHRRDGRSAPIPPPAR